MGDETPERGRPAEGQPDTAEANKEVRKDSPQKDKQTAGETKPKGTTSKADDGK